MEKNDIDTIDVLMESIDADKICIKERDRAADVLQMGKYFLEYVKVMHCKAEQHLET